jgi:phage/plasmid-like protein (TIGR03299 family)
MQQLQGSMTMMGTQDDNTRDFALSVVGDKVTGAQTSGEALHAAGLDGWNLRKLPLTATVREELDDDTLDEPVEVRVPGKYAVVGDFGGVETMRYRSLGVVGERYQIVQNEQTFQLLDDVLDAAGEPLPFEFAGSMYGGRKVFVGMKLPKTISVGGFDDVELRLLAVNTHDGTSPFTLSLHINRVPCTNAIELTKRNAKSAQQHWELRHTSSIEGRVQQARETLKLTFAAADEFEREAQELIEKSITDRQFERLVENVFPIPALATERQRTSISDTRLRVRSIYKGESGTQEQIKGTAWGALNAFVEYADWGREVRVPKGSQLDQREARALAQLDSRHVARFKSDVMGRVLALR